MPSFLLRGAVLNIFALAKASNLVEPGVTMEEFWWDLLSILSHIEVHPAPPIVHLLISAS